MLPSISLSPRFDLFNFAIPKDWFPQPILDRYAKMISQNQSVILDPVDYVNESISGITFPGISDLNMTQYQTSTNSGTGKSQGLGHLRREPVHENTYFSAENILTKIEREFTVTFRRNSGLYNYFLLYETIMWKYDKRSTSEKTTGKNDLFKIYILDDTGSITSKVTLYQPLPTGIDGLEFGYDKMDRQNETFTVTFTFNNIEYEFLPGQGGINPE
jgi:hypothetical protein